MNKYELAVVVNAKIEDDARAAVVEKAKAYVTRFGGTVTDQSWPEFDEAKCVDATVEIAVQVNGKIKARINVATEISNEDAIAAAKEVDAVKEIIDGKQVVKELYVKGKLVNIVVKM